MATEAVRLSSRAAELTARNIPAVLETLARAQAATGQASNALTTAREALGKAQGPQDRALAESLKTLIEQWQRTSRVLPR
ncbi:MAG: hypothetical protein ACR2OZ_20390 [Verrucomicrobiales bacterium]